MTDYRVWPEPDASGAIGPCQCGACRDCQAFAEPVLRMAQCSAAHFELDNPICRHYHAGACGNFDGPEDKERER